MREKELRMKMKKVFGVKATRILSSSSVEEISAVEEYDDVESVAGLKPAMEFYYYCLAALSSYKNDSDTDPSSHRKAIIVSYHMSQ